MLGKKNISEASFSQLFAHLILTKAATWIEVLASSCIEDGFVLNILKVVLEILSSIWIEKSD